MNNDTNIGRLLEAASTGDPDAKHEFYECIYGELKSLASSHRRRWTGNDTLNTTALINEAYVKLAKTELSGFNDRSHFFATASRAMRQILVNYARQFKAAKRGADPIKVTFSEAMLQSEHTLDDLLHINNLLDDLQRDNPRHCQIFECRVFGNMTIDETAAVVGVSAATVKRDWVFLSAWIYRELQIDPDT